MSERPASVRPASRCAGAAWSRASRRTRRTARPHPPSPRPATVRGCENLLCSSRRDTHGTHDPRATKSSAPSRTPRTATALRRLATTTKDIFATQSAATRERERERERESAALRDRRRDRGDLGFLPRRVRGRHDARTSSEVQPRGPFGAVCAHFRAERGEALRRLGLPPPSRNAILSSFLLSSSQKGLVSIDTVRFGHDEEFQRTRARSPCRSRARARSYTRAPYTQSPPTLAPGPPTPKKKNRESSLDIPVSELCAGL